MSDNIIKISNNLIVNSIIFILLFIIMVTSDKLISITSATMLSIAYIRFMIID